MRLRDLLSFTVFGAIIVFAIGYIASLGVRIAPPDNRTNLSMAVSDINGLVVGSNVLLRGVPVGKVTGIKSSIDNATVDFYIEGDHHVPVDTDVRLDNLSALGESYIGLVPRTHDGPMLRNGQQIVAERITQPPSISEMATSVARVLNQLDPEQLKHIIGEADIALPAPETVLPNLSRTSMLLRNETTSMAGRGRDLLRNLQTLLTNAGWVGPTIADSSPYVRQVGPLVQGILVSAVALVKDNNPTNLQLLSQFMDRLQKFLDDRAPDIKVISEALLPNVRSMGASLMNFDTMQFFTNVLAAVPEDGAVTLHVTVPEG